MPIKPEILATQTLKALSLFNKQSIADDHDIGFHLDIQDLNLVVSYSLTKKNNYYEFKLTNTETDTEVGFAECEKRVSQEGESICLGSLLIHEPYQRLGLASFLLNQLCQLASTEKCAVIIDVPSIESCKFYSAYFKETYGYDIDHSVLKMQIIIPANIFEAKIISPDL